MILKRSQLIKCILTVLFLAALSAGFLIFYVNASTAYVNEGLDVTFALVLGVVFASAAFLWAPLYLYTEGHVKPLSEARTVILSDLDPDDYLKRYKAMAESKKYVVFSPDYSLLELIYTAYDMTNDTVNKIETLQKIKALGKKYAVSALILEAGDEFRRGRCEEGDAILKTVTAKGSYERSMFQNVEKGIRAYAKKDYGTAKKYYTHRISAEGILKPDNYDLLLCKFYLALIYSEEGNKTEAEKLFSDCVKTGKNLPLAKKAAHTLETL